MCLGIPGKIVSITDHERKLGMVEISGVKREVNLRCIAEDNHALESYIDEWVLVHVGFAMSRINAAEAASTLDVLTQLGEMQAELVAMQEGAI